MNSQDDSSSRYLLEEADIRGEVVRLRQSFREIVDLHQYPPGVSRLLGECLAASVLLANTLKFEGRLILQSRSSGQLPLLMAECDSALQVRAIARGAREATATEFDQLLGGGQLAITVDPARGRRYQGIVPLGGGSLSASLQHYFEQSEQLNTWLHLACDGERAAGLLLQQLPPELVTDPAERAAQWDQARALAQTLQPGELLELPAADLLLRLYGELPVRLFAPRPVAFRCSCSRERTLEALSALGAAEVEALLREERVITMDCEFCNQQYRFERGDLDDLLGPGAGTVH